MKNNMEYPITFKFCVKKKEKKFTLRELKFKNELETWPNQFAICKVGVFPNGAK